MNYAIFGNDSRFSYLKELLDMEGHKNKSPYNLIILSHKEDPKNYLNLINKDTKIIGGKGYSYSPQYTVLNSIATAEGALALAINNSNFTINNSNVLVLGYGFLGKEVTKTFTRVGAKVTVCSADYNELRGVRKDCKTIHLSQLVNLDYDIIINTIPANILSDSHKCKNAVIYIELASTPAFTKNIWGFNVILASSLPGKYSPFTAAKNLFDEITQQIGG